MALNVLVVDDSALMRNIVIKVLKLSDIDIADIFQAGNGQEALEQLNNNWIDLMLLDINMPVMSGLELLDIVRANPETKDLPIIMVTSESQEKRISTIEQKGAGFVHKPFTPELLRDQILKATGVTHE
ncbi:MAG: chemotaxis signal relay system response regulator CheY [Bacteroidetes bacterium HLUCCA01]|nr:MAG: chemotaxis signal relay system response regulator CheY [Bacteroidetes bacterium HLUCCA01]